MTAVEATVVRPPFVLGLALVADDGRVAQRGFSANHDDLETILGVARHLIRETTPSVDHIELSFANGRIVFGNVGDRVVLVRAMIGPEARVVLDAARGEAFALAAGGDEARPLVAPSEPPRVSRATLVAAVNLVVEAARRDLGGPVIRNYLKKARGPAPILASLTIGLDGKVADPSSADDADVELGRATGRWVRAFLAMASVVAPSIGALDLVAITSGLADPLRAIDFFSTNDRSDE